MIAIPGSVARLFRDGVRFVPASDHPRGDGPVVRVETVGESVQDLEHLNSENLPLLALPHAGARQGEGSGPVVVGVEGEDRHMAAAITEVLSPDAARIALVHVTWLPGTVSSPIEEGGIDNPHPQDLLAYRGARGALVGTADAIRSAGFDVTTHLREDRDPAGPLAAFSQTMDAALLVLGLGRHGAGIGRRMSRHVSIPILYVRARM